MFNLSFKKKLKKILLPINRIIGSFFTEIDRSKSQSNRQTPIKKKIIQLDNKIESFFDKSLEPLMHIFLLQKIGLY